MKYSSLAYAKINISLDIVSKRPDGYHNIKTIMQTVSLSDEIIIECTSGKSINVNTNLPYIPKDSSNIAAKAAEAFFKYANIDGYQVNIEIKKNIPVCAGLGGGSTNAACVLRILDYIFKTGFKRKILEEIAETVGSDIPFCIDGGTKLAEGRGEILTDLPKMPDSHIVICKPGFSCSTPELFERFKREKLHTAPDTEGLIKALGNSDINAIARRMFNVFEDILPHGRDYIESIKEVLLDCGALGAIMTGSGSAVFGLFTDIENAKKAHSKLIETYSECFLVKTINETAPVCELEVSK